MSSDPPKSLNNLSSGEVAGVAIGGTFGAGMIVTYFWWRRRRRRARAAAAKAGDDADESQQQGDGEPSQPDANAKAELPVPESEGPKHEIDGVGKSAAAVRVELDGEATIGPFELPAMAEHAPARDPSVKANATTIFHYTPRPTYVIGEQSPTETDAEARSPAENAVSPLSPKTNSGKTESETQSPTENSVSPLSPKAKSGSTLEPGPRSDGEVSALTPAPLALRSRQNVNEVVEEQAEGGSELKQVSTNSEETERLDTGGQDGESSVEELVPAERGGGQDGIRKPD